MKKFLCLLAAVALIFTFTACSSNSEIEDLKRKMKDLQQQVEDAQSRLEQQEGKLTELEIELEIYNNLENLKNYPKEFDLKIVGDCFAFSFNTFNRGVEYSLAIPNGVIINSEEGIEKLATKSYGDPEKTPHAEAAEFLRLLKTEHYFNRYSFLLINLLHSSSDKIIGFSSYEIEDNVISLIFDFEHHGPPGAGTEDIQCEPYIFCIKNIQNILNYKINCGYGEDLQKDLIFY